MVSLGLWSIIILIHALISLELWSTPFRVKQKSKAFSWFKWFKWFENLRDDDSNGWWKRGGGA